MKAYIPKLPKLESAMIACHPRSKSAGPQLAPNPREQVTLVGANLITSVGYDSDRIQLVHDSRKQDESKMLNRSYARRWIYMII